MNGMGKLLKIYIGESESYHHTALYHALIEKIKTGALMALQDVEIIRYSHAKTE